MAFLIVKMGKTHQNFSFPLQDVDPHLIQQCLGPPQAPPQNAAPTVEAMSHTDAVKSPLVSMARPKFARKSTLVRGPIPNLHYLPHLWTHPTYDADPSFSTMHWTDRRTYAQTDRSFTGKFDDYRMLRL